MEKEIENLTAKLYSFVKDSDFDPGHKCLMEELIMLLRHAGNYEFHDFKNKLFDTPKIALDSALQLLKDHLRTGHYDN